jgi:predicted TIM-barrel fold metal-dependent hydrolase
MTSTNEPWTGPVIDAHHHVWDPAAHFYPWLSGDLLVPHRYGDYTSIKRRYLPDDYRRDVAGQNLVASIYCEAEWDPTDPIGETRYVTALAEASGLPNAMVAQGWLDRDDVAEVLAGQAAFPLVRSIRHKPGGPASPAAVGHGERTLMCDERWRRGYALLARHGLHFDLQVPWWNLPEADLLARDFPDTLLIVDHTGVPNDRDPQTLAGWRRGMERVAARPNTAVKISGLCIRDRPWSTADNAQVILDTISMFGPERVMFGSNFPVDGMFATFARIFDTFREVTASFDEAAKRAMFHDTAARIYRPLRLGSPAGTAPSDL